MSPTRHALLCLAIAALATSATGCIFKSSTSQASSESSSASSSGLSRSLTSPSRSSSPSSREADYALDIRDYTAEWVLSGGDNDSFERRISQIAKEDGITDWRQDDSTYRGIGRGLKKAGLKGDRYKDVAAQLGGSDPQRMQWIQKGYDAESEP